jgi:hypothetical protein
MTIPAILFRDQGDDNRSCKRFRVRIGAVRRDAAATVRDLTVHDVSASGFLMQADAVLPRGTQITVELPGAIVRQACISWASNDLYGAMFSEMLAPAELEQILQSNTVVWPTMWSRRTGEEAPITQDRDRPLRHPELVRTDDDKLPLPVRFRIILGTTAFLWASGVAGVLWATA